MSATSFTLTTRAEALRIASHAAAPGVATAAAFAATKSLYAAIMPVRKKRDARPATALAARVAALAGVDLDTVAGLNAIPLTQYLDPEAAELITRAAGPLILIVRAVAEANEIVRPVAYRTQEAFAGRPCTSRERDNFRTRVGSALLLDAVDALTRDSDLLTDEPTLVQEIVAAANASMADEGNSRWGSSWIAGRRRENGTAPVTVAMTPQESATWTTHATALRPQLERVARGLARGDRTVAEDLVQDTLLKLFGQGGVCDRATFQARAFDYLRKANADRVVRDIARSRVEQSVDWTERSGEGVGKSYEDRTFGSASREWSGLTEAHDGLLDARSELDVVLREATKEESPVRRTIARELARIAIAARHTDQHGTCEVDAFADRTPLIRHLTTAAQAAGAPSLSAARSAVEDVLASIAEQR